MLMIQPMWHREQSNRQGPGYLGSNSHWAIGTHQIRILYGLLNASMTHHMLVDTQFSVVDRVSVGVTSGDLRSTPLEEWK